jgi:hypothetical protein
MALGAAALPMKIPLMAPGPPARAAATNYTPVVLMHGLSDSCVLASGVAIPS